MSAAPTAEDLYAEYLGRVERGEKASFERLLVRHRGIADELRALHRLHRQLDGMAPRVDRQPQLDRDHYRIGDRIGRGGMGEVFRVDDLRLDRSLALKILTRGSGSTAARIAQRFEAEAIITARLDHPSIVPVHETGLDDAGRPFFTMKLVDGVDLDAQIRLTHSGRPGWSERDTVSALVKVCDALAFAHDRGVVHRDLKPQNVMVGRFGEVFVMDWGLALDRGRSELPSGGKALDSAMTLHGDVLGTPCYMAPEQAAAPSAIDHRADVYSVGAMLYHALAGRPPYTDGPDPRSAAVLRELTRSSPTPLRRMAPSAPRELVAIADKAMARRPERRYADALEMRADLLACLSGREVQALELTRLQRAGRIIKRNRMVLALLLSLTAGAGYGLFRLTGMSDDLAHRIAIDNAYLKASMLEMVVERYDASVSAHKTDGHADGDGIPFSATFLRELGEDISRNDMGVRVRQYSTFPFAGRDPMPMDDFESDALKRLRDDSKTPVTAAGIVDGHDVVRFAIARTMKARCVACHNSHPDSPKRDWEVGDVRGVLEVIQPIEMHPEEREDTLRDTLTIVASILIAIWSAAATFLYRGARSRPD